MWEAVIFMFTMIALLFVAIVLAIIGTAMMYFSCDWLAEWCERQWQRRNKQQNERR